MSSIVKLMQGSAEWHEHRRKHRNASETAAVLGVSPWMTPYQLWQIKLGLVEPEVTAAMLHGTQLEPMARAAYETLTGHVMQPLVLVDGEFSASLDGLTLSGDRVLEIKCPFKRRESSLWKAVAEGRSPSTMNGRYSTSSWLPRPSSRMYTSSMARKDCCSRCSRSPKLGCAFTMAGMPSCAAYARRRPRL